MPAITYEKYLNAQQKSAGKPYPEYVRNLKEIGVKSYEVSVADQFTRVYGSEGDVLEVPGRGTPLVVSKTFFEPHLKAALESSRSGLTGYPEFLSEIAEAGIERYTADLNDMRITYYGKDPQNRFEEVIPTAE